MDAYVHETGQDYKHLPEIYQIEACSACNLQCPMCERTTHMGRQPGLLKMELLRTMHERGDFNGTSFIELQLAGEPTLHPELFDIIKFLKEKVGLLVGLSTHGLNMTPRIISSLLMLDALTISVDSVNEETYHKMRYPAHIEDLIVSVSKFMDVARARKRNHLHYPFTELQLIKTEMFEGTGNVGALRDMMTRLQWDQIATVRTTGDSFIEMQDRGTVPLDKRNRQLCLNPFRSVTVTHSGDVVSCCYIFDPKRDEVNYYGNLYESSLADIWASTRVGMMQQLHRNGEMLDQCAKCYQVSPCEIHSQIVARLVRSRVNNG